MLLAEIEAPSGAVAEFTLLFAVILLGPILIQRVKVPGIIGLLLGGFAIGPHGLDLVGAGNHTLPELGQLGLLYLMFVAGLELDLNLLREYRRAALSFGVLTFVLPLAAGIAVGVGLGWALPASLLLGSLIASHTLILYPTVRDAGLGGNPAVASAVGATVLTDTLALVVLAGVAGTETGSGSTATVLGEIGLGLVVLLVAGLVVLPRIARVAMAMWGGDRAARYLVAVLSFLLMAALAETFGIEGIVGAFFAGISLNRLVPNEGPSMERIEFFGSTVFIPVFLVSVGLLLDPSVMFSPDTLGVAGLITLACVGGKAAAAALTRPILRFSWAEAGAIFALTTPQAAATLAATLVGFDIGLFSTSVVNAVLVLILVTIVVPTVLAPRFIRSIPAARPEALPLGGRVLLAARPGGPTSSAVHLARRLTRPDAGVADLFIAHRLDERIVAERDLAATGARVFRGSLDGEVHRVVGRDVAEAVAHAARAAASSVVVIDVDSDDEDLTWEPTDRESNVPVVLLVGHGDARPERVWLVDDRDDDPNPFAAEVATRLAGSASRVQRIADGWPADLGPGDAVVVGLDADDDRSAVPAAADGVLIAAVFEPTVAAVAQPVPHLGRDSTPVS